MGFKQIGGPIVGSLYEGSRYFESILGAPFLFGKLPYVPLACRLIPHPLLGEYLKLELGVKNHEVGCLVNGVRHEPAGSV